MRVHQAHPSEIDAVIAMPAGPGVLGMTKEALQAEFDAGRMRPEWTWVAVDDEDRIVGRALWWGRDGSAPIALDVLDTAGHVASSIDIGSGLLRAGHDALAADGYGSPRPTPCACQWVGGIVRHASMQSSGGRGPPPVPDSLR